MNRLERSVTSNTISAHRKDLTSKLAGFLDNSCQILVNFIRDTQMRLLDDHAVEATMSILEFCWDLFRFSLQPDFEDAVFLTYIKLAQDIQQKYNTSVYLVKVWFSMLDSFHSTWRLNTGQSMQLMWEKWRPATPSDPVRLQQMSELEHLCSRFDQNILSTRLPMTDLSELRRSLAQAQKSLLLGADGNQLVQVCLTSNVSFGCGAYDILIGFNESHH